MNNIIGWSDFKKFWKKFEQKDEFIAWMGDKGDWERMTPIVRGEWLELWAKENNMWDKLEKLFDGRE